MDSGWQCQALTGAGFRCWNSIHIGGNLCELHRNMVYAGKTITYITGPNKHNIVINKDNFNINRLDSEYYKKQNISQSIINLKSDPNTTCLSCLETFTEDQIIKCTESSVKYNHTVCKECLCNYMKIVLNEKKSVGCMFSATGCCGRYNDYDMMIILSQDVYKKYLECAEVEQAVNMAKLFDNYCLCPFCSKFALTIDNIEGIPDTHLEIKCPRCVKSWCVKCRNESHVPDPCGKIKVFDKNAICRIIERTIDDATIHKCPKCFTKYKKEEENGACNLMTCPTCHTYSCYVCGIMIEPKVKPEGTIKYWHFKGHSDADKNTQCQLYYKYGTQKEIDEGNKAYENKKITEGLEKLVTINISNLEIACEIVRQINALKFKIKAFPDIDAILNKADADARHNSFLGKYLAETKAQQAAAIKDAHEAEERFIAEAEKQRATLKELLETEGSRAAVKAAYKAGERHITTLKELLDDEAIELFKEERRIAVNKYDIYTKEQYEYDCIEKNKKLLAEEKRKKQCIIM
jgi:hypothetical protein